MDLTLRLDDSTPKPLHEQLYDELRRSILSGRLAPGTRLPSTRALATNLRLSRATVVQSFGQLLDEGYLEARHGAGTFVSLALPDETERALPVGERERAAPASVALSEFGERLLRAGELEPRVPPGFINFRDGRPAFDLFPMDRWRKLLARHADAGAELLDYSPDPAGHRPLREAIAGYLTRARAVRCTAERIVIVSGSQQALDLTSRLLLDNGDAVAVETPGYPGALRVFSAYGAELVPIPVDGHGMVVSRLFDALALGIRLAYVTPSHQFPTGAVLSLARRLELLRWAHRAGAMIIEDDYDSAYRYGERPIPALQGLDDGDAVIYVGTFSKVMFPALRIGYVVLPPDLVGAFGKAKAYSDRQSPLLEQFALADFITEGHFERHLRRMRAIYAARRETLVRELIAAFGDAVTIGEEAAGMHVFARFATPHDDDELVRRAARERVFLTAPNTLSASGRGSGAFVLGFTELDEAQLIEGVRRLARAFA